MVRSIPSNWDETMALPPSEIGEVAVLARRKGDAWFLAAANGVYERTIRVDLSFRGEGSYQGLLLRDGPRAAALDIERVTLRRGEPLFIRMPSGGGFVGCLTP